jgi:DNA-nicking Smr family endonuclease
MHRRRTPRGLRPEERELWHRVADTMRPLPGRTPFGATPGGSDTGTKTSARSPERDAEPPRQAPAAPIQPFRIGARHQDTAPPYDRTPTAQERLAGQPLQMDRKAFDRLNRGKLAPQARIDLHGMTLAEAQPALTRFILSAQAARRRLVLVITGKGRPGSGDGPIPRRPGALRYEVPIWLSRPPLAGAVLQVAQAHVRHGGSGAYYVYLRRSGK